MAWEPRLSQTFVQLVHVHKHVCYLLSPLSNDPHTPQVCRHSPHLPQTSRDASHAPQISVNPWFPDVYRWPPTI